MTSLTLCHCNVVIDDMEILCSHYFFFNLVRNRFRSRWAFTLQNINRFSELNGIKLIHLLEVVSNRFSFEPVQIASGD